jgi:uncharacterized tellurite resistance protein B-like protein
MSFLTRFLGMSPSDPHAQEPQAMQSLLGQLRDLDVDRARYLAAFAYVLSRVAAADRIIEARELEQMKRILLDEGALPTEQAELVVTLASGLAHEMGGAQDYVVTRRLAELTPRDERERILDCAIQVAAADQRIDGYEEKELRGIAKQLGFSDSRFLQALNRYRDLRSVFQTSSES